LTRKKVRRDSVEVDDFVLTKSSRELVLPYILETRQLAFDAMDPEN
jgi:hypothetical protein